MRTYWTFAPLIAAMSLCACERQVESPHEEIRPVQTLMAGRASGTAGASYSGSIVARYESQLAFRAPGKVIARLVEVGSAVKRGQALMRLSPEQEVLNLSASEADVDAAQTRLAQARIDLQRTGQLLAKQFASQAEMDQQRLLVEQYEAQWRAAHARRNSAANQQGYTVLTADRDGVVTAILAEAGQVVAAGQPVMALAADGEREVSISVPESRVEELRSATTLEISLWAHPGKTWQGTLRELAPATDSVTRTYAARVSIRQPDAGLMRMGMTASVGLRNVEGATSIRLPLTAIVDQNGGRYVWVVDANTSKVRQQAVELGSAENDSVAVVSGLNGGEMVVTAGVHRLLADQRVNLSSVKASTEAGK